MISAPVITEETRAMGDLALARHLFDRVYDVVDTLTDDKVFQTVDPRMLQATRLQAVRLRVHISNLMARLGNNYGYAEGSKQDKHIEQMGFSW